MSEKKFLSLLHYILLGIIVSGGVFFFYYFAGQPQKQYVVILLTGFLYFLWGVLHHVTKGDFHLKVVVEYLLVALLAIVLLRGAIFR